jgi:hypothetical protein
LKWLQDGAFPSENGFIFIDLRPEVGREMLADSYKSAMMSRVHGFSNMLPVMNTIRNQFCPFVFRITLCFFFTCFAGFSAEIPAGPNPQIPDDPEAIAPGPYPNDSVTAVSYIIDASQVTQHNSAERDDIIFSMEGQGPIPWTLTSYGRAQVAPRIGAPSEEASNSNLGVIPFDIIVQGRRYEWNNDLSFWAPSGAAWRPHPSKGVMLGTIRKNGEEWDDQASHFYGVLSVPASGSDGEGYSMVDGAFGPGDMDVVTDKVGIESFAAIDFSLAWFPFDQGWTGGFISSPSPDFQEGEWLAPGYHSSDLPDDAASLIQWTRAFATWAVPGALKLPGVNSKTDGMLFMTSVAPSSASGMILSPAAKDDGSGWDVWGRFNTESDPLFQEESNLDFSFLFVPYNTDRLIGAHIRGTDGAVINGRGNFIMKRLGTGQYELSIPNKTGKNGMVILQATGRHRQNGRDTEAASRDFLSYEETEPGKFVIESRYYQNDSSFPLEDTEFYFAWVDFIAPLAPAGSTPLPDPPVISQQPANVEAQQGESATFTVKASGEGPFEYQWQLNETDIPDANTDTFTIASASTTDSGTYRVLVSNLGGLTTSSTATLTVHTPPVITQQPSNRSIKVGETLSLSVGVQGTGNLQYQWQFNQQNLSDQTRQTLTISSVQLSHAGQYRVIVTSPGGQVFSESAVVTVDASVAAQAPQITRQPQSQTVAVGAEVRLSVQATGSDPLSYRWQISNFNIPGASGPEFVISDAQPGDSGEYKVVVSNEAGSVISQIALVTVTQAPVITRQPQSVIAQSGQDIAFTVEATGLAPLTFQWRFSGFNIPGARSAQFAISNVQPADSGSYSVIVSDASGAQTISQEAILTVSEDPVVQLSIASASLSGGGILIEWEGGEGIVLQAKAALSDSVWRDVPGTEGQNQTLQALIGQSAFYRLIQR